MARRLNLLLAELSARRSCGMTTKSQLDQLFRSEIERMTAHLEDLAFAARYAGTYDDVREMEADIEVGWAYRLLQLFGTGRRLTLDKDCPGRAILTRNGIPDPHIAVIAATHRSEQAAAQNPVFDREIRQQMSEVGLPDTIANRERAKMEIFRAKADALLNVGTRWPLIDRRQNALTASTLPEDERPQFLPDATQPAPAEEPDASSGEAASQEPELAGGNAVPSADPDRSQAPTSPASPAERAAPEAPAGGPALGEEIISAAPVAAAEEANRAALVLGLADFEAEFTKLRKNKGNNWTDASAKDAHVLVVTLRDILDECGVLHSGEIRQHHIAALRQHFNDIPTHYGKSARLRIMKPAALRAFAAEQVARAVRLNKPSYSVGLSAATIRKHLGNLDTFLRHVRANGYTVGDWALDDLRPAKPKLGTIRLEQVKPSPEAIRPIFDLPVFTGCLDEFNQDKPGKAVFHSASYFLPVLFVYLGARRNEFAGLATRDVIATANGPAIHIRNNTFRTIKNPQSDRLLPVPDELVRLGFMDYVAAIERLGHERLFPELYSPALKTNDPGDRFYKDFVPLLKASPVLADGLWERTIHAFRHGLANTLKQLGVEIAIIDDLSGRLGSGETQTRYTNVAGLSLLREKLRQYPIITGHLAPTPVRLLPWVEANTSPPWAGRKPGDRFTSGGRTPERR
ncbi:integrase [Aurantimonas sp. CSK15Z-1]|nr:integrase [Aurantimonas sp. CSK15Z-1]